MCREACGLAGTRNLGGMMENTASSTNNTRQVQAVFRGHMILRALSKLSRYRAGCHLFEKKYGAPFDSVNQGKRGQGAEDFALEDDLLDWEYARAALRWWEGQLREFRNASIFT